jgi:protein SCO1/2
MRNVRLVLWGAVALALAGLAWLMLRPAPGPMPTVQSSGAIAIGGPFTLTGADGRPFASSRLNGRPAAIFFGFTHCPDVCPTTLARLTKLRRSLGKGDDALAIVFITVDPERDGPKEVGAYSALFDTPVIGLTGSPDQIARVKQQFGVYSEKTPMPAGDYGVAHTATVFLMDRNGQFQSTIAAEENDAAALAKLKRLTA